VFYTLVKYEAPIQKESEAQWLKKER
jgi:hypothetical protein